MRNTSNSRMLDYVLDNIKNLEADWQQDLEDMNVWEDVYRLYQRTYKTKDDDLEGNSFYGNTMLAFIVLSYDNQSPFLEPKKDRYDNKLKILTRLAGPAALTNRTYRDIVYCQDTIGNEIINWYIDYQRDVRWKFIITFQEYVSMAMAMSLAGYNDSQEGVSIGKMLSEAKARDKEAAALLNEIRTEFLTLDNALVKEDKPKITDVTNKNFLRHEEYINALQKRKIMDSYGFELNM